jgi:hypothetical protein
MMLCVCVCVCVCLYMATCVSWVTPVSSSSCPRHAAESCSTLRRLCSCGRAQRREYCCCRTCTCTCTRAVCLGGRRARAPQAASRAQVAAGRRR